MTWARGHCVARYQSSYKIIRNSFTETSLDIPFLKALSTAIRVSPDMIYVTGRFVGSHGTMQESMGSAPRSAANSLGSPGISD